MKYTFILLIIIFVLFTNSNLFASSENSLSKDESTTMEEPFSKIIGKVILFIKQNPSKNNLTLEGLLQEKVISDEEYNFLIENKIKYNPPSSAGPYDNKFTIFERNNEDGTVSLILMDLVDKSLPAITKTGTLADLERFVSEWYRYTSTKKNLSLFKDRNLYYFSLHYWDNEHWNKQHILLTNLPVNSIDEIEKFKQLLKDNDLRYREHTQQTLTSFTVWLPSDLPFISKLSKEILVNVYQLSQKDIIKFTPDGFRFEMQKDND